MVRHVVGMVEKSGEVVDTNTGVFIEKAVRNIADMGLENDVDMPNYLACVSVSLLATIAINEGMDKKEAKKMMGKISKEVTSSLKKFHNGKVIDRGVLEEPQADEQPETQ